MRTDRRPRATLGRGDRGLGRCAGFIYEQHGSTLNRGSVESIPSRKLSDRKLGGSPAEASASGFSGSWGKDDVRVSEIGVVPPSGSCVDVVIGTEEWEVLA